MKHFSFTGVPTVDYYYLYQETEPRVVLGSTAIYASAALAKQGADILFSGPIGNNLNMDLLIPLKKLGILFELHQLDGIQPWLKMVFAANGQVTSLEIDTTCANDFKSDQLSKSFWNTHACWIGTSSHNYAVSVANHGQRQSCEIILSPQGQFGYRMNDIVTLIEKTDFLNCNTSEMASLGNGHLDVGLDILNSINPDLQILLTRGRYGAWYLNQDEVFSIPAIPQIESEFLVGAGDTFAATFHYHRIQGNPIQTCLQRATVASSLKIRGFSYTQMATLDEILSETKKLEPLLEVTNINRLSHEVTKWFRTENPDSTQEGTIELK